MRSTRTVQKVVYIEVPFDEVWPGQYHDGECNWPGDDDEGCDACSEELDEAYDWATKQAETQRWVVLDFMLSNKPIGFAKESGGDQFWEVELGLGRRRRGE